MNIKSLVWPRNRLLRAVNILVTVMVLYTLLGFFLVPRVIRHYTVSILTDQLSREISIEQVGFNPYLFTCEMRGLAIGKKDGEGNWVAVDSLLVNLQASSAYHRALVVSQLRIDQPRISITRHSDNSYNFSDLMSSGPDAEPQEKEGEPLRYSINNIKILSGKVELEDRTARTRHTLSNLRFTLPTLSNFPYALETFVEPSLSGRINQMSFDLDGRAKPFAESRQSRFDLVAEDLSLPHYLGYLPVQRNFGLSDGRLSFDLRLIYAHPEQQAPHLKLAGDIELRDLQMSLGEKREHTFCAVPRLRLEVGEGNLLAGDFQLKRLEILEPQVNLIRREDGSFLLPALGTGSQKAPDTNASSPQEKSAGSFSLALDQLQLRSGSVSLTDRSVSPEFATALNQVEIELAGLKTDSRDAATFRVNTQTSRNETLSVNGSLTMNPMRLEAGTSFSNILLEAYSPYLAPYFKGRINTGTCDLGAEMSLQLDDAPDMRLTDVSLGLEELSVSDGAGHQAIVLSEFSLREGKILPSEREITVGSVNLRDFDFRIKRSADGRLNITEMVTAGAGQSSGNATEGDAEPWRFALNELDAEGGRTVFTDATFPSRVEMDVSDISFQLKQLTSKQGQKAALDASMRIGNQGRLALKGDVGIAPMDASLDIGLERLDLGTFEPILRDHVNIGLNRGYLDLDGRMDVQETGGKQDLSVSFSGNTAVREMSLSGPEKESEVLAWESLELQQISLMSSRPSIRVQNIDFKGLNARMILDEEGQLNIGRIFPPGESSGQQGAGQEASGPGAAVVIDRFSLSRANLDFVDRSVSPGFRTSLANVQCDIENLSNQDKDPATISFRGNLGSHSPLRLEGRINVLGEQFFSDLNIQLSNMSLSPFSPYSGKYIGYAISKGKVFLDSSIRIDGNALDSENSLLLDQFTLGEKVDSPQAVNAPVKLGIALLKDRQGKISIDKAVRGDLNDPEFSVGDLVVRVFVNVLVKAAQSPFAILGAMIPGGGEDINQVLFDPGQESLDRDAREKLEKLGTALYERPELKVDILGRADTSSDRAALHEARFRRLLRQQKYRDMSEEERSGKKIEDVRITQEEFADYLWQAYKAAPMPKPENFLGAVKKLPPDELEQRLRSHVSIEQQDLRQLAASRAKSVLSHLREEGAVSPERLFRQKPELGSDGEDAYTRVEIRIH